MSRNRLRILVAGLLFSTGPGLQAGVTDAGTTADMSQAKQTEVQKPSASRRGPALDGAVGMVFVLTLDDIRRSGANPIRPVPGMDVVGRFEGSTQTR